MNTKPVTLRLVLSVTFLPNGESVESLRSRLLSIAETAANRGQMTGDGPAEVDNWGATVEDVTAEIEAAQPRTLHQLVKDGRFYRAGVWVTDGGELFDLTNDDERLIAVNIASVYRAKLVPVENCVRD